MSVLIVISCVVLFFFFVFFFFFFSSRRRHTRYIGDWSSDVCSSDLGQHARGAGTRAFGRRGAVRRQRAFAMEPEKGRQPRQMESRERLLRGCAKNRGHSNTRSVWRLPVARGICRAFPRERRRPGPRQQPS